MFCKPTIKIPISSYHSNNSSHTPSPSSSPGTQRHNHSPGTRRHMLSSRDLSQQLANGSGLPSHHPDEFRPPLDPGDEVRSKNRTRQRRAESVTAECGEDGVKSIMDILNCADVQLQASKEFAEKLAKRR